MVYNREGDRLILDGTSWTIGMPVYANEESDFSGLYGYITEIRTNDDQETENDTPDIYCHFNAPVLPDEIRKLEERFSILHGCPKKLDELGLDMVIMSPEMLMPLGDLYSSRTHLRIYAVVEDWVVDEEGGHNEDLFTSRDDAIRIFHERLTEEQQNGIIPNWQDDDSFCTDTGDALYECWIEGEYLCNHYKISVEEKLLLSEGTMPIKDTE